MRFLALPTILLVILSCTNGTNIDFPLVTEFSQQNCIDKSDSELYANSYYLKINENVNLPYCEKLPTNKLIACKTKPCAPLFNCEWRCNNINTISQTCSVNADCPDITSCAQLCYPIPGTCMGYYAKTSIFASTTFTAKIFKPTCLDDGTWAPKQCKGGLSGRCYCYDSVGKRIFGEALYSDSDDMTCACSRRKADLIQSGLKDQVFFHCDSKGNYEKLQCEAGQCWCAEPKTGEVTAPVVPEKAMKYLPCYSVASNGDQYYRKCDSEKQAQTAILKELTTRGVKFSSLRYLVCDGDGAFGSFNVSDARPCCTWRDGSLLGSYCGSNLADLGTIDCNCARDIKRYGIYKSCTQMGNYNFKQTVDTTGEQYCVDSDGFRKSEYFASTDTVDEAKCATYY